MVIYADENIEEAIIQGLRRRGIEVISVREEGYIGKDDEFHLQKAKQLGAVVLPTTRIFLFWLTGGEAMGASIMVSCMHIHRTPPLESVSEGWNWWSMFLLNRT